MSGRFRDQIREEMEREKGRLQKDLLDLVFGKRSRGTSGAEDDLPEPRFGQKKRSSSGYTDFSLQSTKVFYESFSDRGNGIVIDVEHLPFFNYAMHQVGEPLVKRIDIMNRNMGVLQSLYLEARIRPIDAMVTQNVPSLQNNARHTIEDLFIPVDRERLSMLSEPERGSLAITLFSQGTNIYQSEQPLILHPYNHCIIDKEFPLPIATFVMPGCNAVETILDKVMEQHHKHFGSKSLAGYQNKGEHVLPIIQSIYHALRDDFKLGYINPPHNTGLGYDYEGLSSLGDLGENVPPKIGQRIFTPNKVLAHRRGTCLDLALLYCSLLERCKLHSLLIIGCNERGGGHAWIGCMLAPTQALANAGLLPSGEPLTLEREQLYRLMDERVMLPINSTSFTDESRTLEDAARVGVELFDVEDFNNIWAVHNYNCHQAGAVPLRIDD